MTAQRGFVLWFTGMPRAGKSTLARHVSGVLAGAFPVEILDGDEVRARRWPNLGFSKADRDENVCRLGALVVERALQGCAVVVAAVSPYAEARAKVRQSVEASGIRFFEVYLRADLAALMARDHGGFYQRAHRGEIRNATGVDDPYQAPTSPELTLDTDREGPAESTRRLAAFLVAAGLIPPRPGLPLAPVAANDGAE